MDCVGWISGSNWDALLWGNSSMSEAYVLFFTAIGYMFMFTSNHLNEEKQTQKLAFST